MSAKKVLTSEETVKYVFDEVELVRKESEAKLKAALSLLSPESAEDVATYFFGQNPDMSNLTAKLLKELSIVR